MELAILRWIQSFNSSFLDSLFQIVTMFGEEVIILLVILTTYYVINKEMGERLAFTVFCSLLVNTAIKDAFQFSRPIGEEGIRSLRLETAGGHSFPSGHTQTASTVAYFFATNQGKGWQAYLLATLLGSAVGLSRLYLGVHYPKDVVVGLLLGLIIPIIIYKLINVLVKPFYLYAFALLVFLPGLFLNQGTTYYQLYGFLSGFVLAVYLEKRFVNFKNNISLFKRLFRLMGGVGFVVAVLALGQLLPVGLVFSFLEYFVMSLVVIFVYPWCFTKLNF